MTQRHAQLQRWAQQIEQNPDLTLRLISGDASFRKYYRAANRIWVDAPPETEKNREFIDNAQALQRTNITAPVVHHSDLEQGFLCVSDLGDDALLSRLNDESVSAWYGKALQLLPLLTNIKLELPVFDAEFMARENSIFPEWLLEKHLQLTLSIAEKELLAETFALLTANNLQQPQVVMHRDFHSRNLMVLADESLAVIDFQDMVLGPLTYDAVSLLKDCYCRWPDAVIEQGVTQAYQLYSESGILSDVSYAQFVQWLDLTGMQRHLKAAGIFTRLYHRDGKSGYLKDIPRTLGYVRDVAARYPQLAAFAAWLEQRVLPAFDMETAS
ncbi:phosphotransferase [uncultured Tolumonas sp.]|uniref:aminoglycoside phosphotransferase family protein n=1 Tax=uncultured Tolumonas sp. TaxID=263765 RepID=UPI002A0A347C|nr:phosphotransferase [uncultured Tolumonas sp.]